MNIQYQLFNKVYALRNKINTKVYIGQTWQILEDRWNYGHGYRGCRKIERAIKKYGIKNFYYEVLIFCGTQEAANYWETYFINKYNSIKQGYNICITGEKAPMTGRKHSKKSRNKMSSSRKGQFIGINNPFYGKKHSESSKQQISEALMGNTIWLGKKHSEESKKKISDGGKGQRRSIATEFKPGKKWVPNSATKLNPKIVASIRKDHLNGMTGVSIANKYNISRASVSRIINNTSWNK